MVVPAGWKELEISELCVTQKSRIDPRVSGGGDICVELEHIAGGSGQLLGVTNTSGTSSLKTKFEPGDVLFGKLRAYLRKYWLAEFAGVCSTEIWALSANRTEAVPGFLAQIVRTEDFIEAASLSYGTHMPRSDWAIVSKLIVSVPPLKEQEAIAEALSDADAAIESFDALIVKKRDVKQATMQQLLTGRTRLPGFTADWKEVRLGDLGSTFGGLTGKSSKDFGDGNSSFVTFMNVMSNVVLNNQGTEKVRIGNGERQSQLLEGDVIFNGSSETPEEVGFGSAVPTELSGIYLNSFCFGFRRKDTKSLDPKFFAYLTRSPLGRDIIRPMAQGSTRYNIAKTNLLNGRFPLPPLKEQEAIAEALTVMDDELEALTEQVSKLRMMKEGMMQDLLTGKVRLV